MKSAQSDSSMGVRPKVLIVDDNSDVRRLYAIGLNQRGFEVKLAANGAEAVEREATGADIPVIVISGHPQPEESQGDPRIHSWLTKPITIDQLVEEMTGRALARQPG
jgi:CheY-like chemotaxis protein